MRSRWLAAIFGLLCLLMMIADPSVADVSGHGGQGGVSSRVHADELHRWAQEQRESLDSHTEYFVYRTIDSCGSGRGTFGTEECYKISVICPGEDGPLVDIERRLMNADGTPASGWSMIGRTCLPNDVPGAAKRPTMRMIIDAMHETPWARASVGFQPKGNRTLVTLPNYYSANWSASGYGPGEIDVVDPSTMYGYRVEIRPKLIGLTYHFGDGSAIGPTTSMGGVYPTGDITHSYNTSGSYSVHLTVEWGADFRVNGGSWAEIPDTVTVQQPTTQITVLTATNRLVTR